MSIEIYDELSHIPDLVWDIQYEPLRQAYLDRGKAKGGNMMGLYSMSKDVIVVLLMPMW